MPTDDTDRTDSTNATPGELHDAFSEDGWSDRELAIYIEAIAHALEPRAHLGPLWQAVLDPELPREDHRDDRFYEVLAWYIDKSTAARGDGELTLRDVREQLVEYGRRYLATSMDPAKRTTRLQSWKFIQKLRLLEREIRDRAGRGEGASYPYRPREMMRIDGADEWNAANTITTRAAFEARVIEGSRRRPVLVKFGLTYCAHCLLLEQLGSVPAVADRYASDIDVVKLWWNPHDASMAELNQIAGEQGVTSSPWFILYADAAIANSGYAFPDENGDGLEEFLAGHVTG